MPEAIQPDRQRQPPGFDQALLRLEQLRRFEGPPQEFWNEYLAAMSLLAGARLGVLLHRPTGDQAGWQRVAIWPAKPPVSLGIQQFVRELDGLAGVVLEKEVTAQQFGSASSVALRIETDTPEEIWVAAFHLDPSSAAEAGLALRQLKLVASLAGVYRQHRTAAEARNTLAHFSSVLDLTALLNAQHRFLAVAMTLCNEIAARHKCQRVSLGWREDDGMKLQAISHTERFEKKMDAVRRMEQAMEESLDQDEIIIWPAPEDDRRISRDHAALAADQKTAFLCSVPFRVGGQTVAVLLCERSNAPFLEDEQRLLVLSTEMAVRRLSELKKWDRWFGARWMQSAREGFARLLGVEHTWAKVIAILVAVGLGVLFFGRMNYRVEAPFILRTEDIAILTAPFDGFIDQVPHEVGDVVRAGDALLKLDTRELLLEEVAAVADLDRYSREAEKARAVGQLADMRIAQAQADQARARLELVRHRLAQAEIKAAFDGVIVEGDLKKRIGAPVTQGDALVRLARLDRMYAECDVREQDIHEVREHATGEVAFASQPKLKFPVELERVEPAAQAKQQDNVFLVRCRFDQPLEDWWRPGMSGVAKINVGKRTFFWVVSHRTVDFLRMFFWL